MLQEAAEGKAIIAFAFRALPGAEVNYSVIEFTKLQVVQITAALLVCHLPPYRLQDPS